MNTEQIKDQLQGFRAEFSKVTRSRHPIEIRQFIVGSHVSRWRQWYQLCIETDAKWTALQEAEAKHRIAALEIEELELQIQSLKMLDGDRLMEIRREKLQIELQLKRAQYERAKGYMIGALKEIEDFLRIAKTEFADFWGKSEDQWAKEGEQEYWISRLASQIGVDLITFGKIQAGNLDALLKLEKADQKEVLKRGLAKQFEYNEIAEPAQKEFEKEWPPVKQIGKAK